MSESRQRRQALKQAVEARLDQARDHRAVSALLSLDAVTEALELAALVHDHDGEASSYFALGWFHWYRALALGEPHGHSDRQAAFDSFAPIFTCLPNLASLPPESLPVLGARMALLAPELLERAQDSLDLTLVTNVVALLRRALAVVSIDSPGRVAVLSNLAAAHRIRFEWAAQASDLDEAVGLAHRAVAWTRPDNAAFARRLSNLGLTLRMRYDLKAIRADLDNAVHVGERAVAASHPTDPDLGARLANLAHALRLRFDRTGVPSDLEVAVAVARRAMDATPMDHPFRGGVWAILAHTLHAQFAHTGAPADLEEAISAARHAVQFGADHDPRRVGELANLASALKTRFLLSGTMADLDEACALSRTAVSHARLSHTASTTVVAGYSDLLITRFDQGMGASSDLDEAVEVSRQAATITQHEHTDWATRACNHGIALWSRGQRLDAAADLDAAVDVGRRAVAATATNDSRRPAMLINLSVFLASRVLHAGSDADLTESIDLVRQAVQAAASSESGQAVRVSSVLSALRGTAKQASHLAMLDDIHELMRERIVSVRSTSPERAVLLFELAESLLLRSDRTTALIDLDHAATLIRQAAQIHSVRPRDRAQMLARLTDILRIRFDLTGDSTALSEAIDVGRQAAALPGPDSPSDTGRLANLGLALNARFRHAKDPADLDEAIDLVRRSLTGARLESSPPAARWSNLGILLQDRFEVSGNIGDLDEAVEYCRRSATAFSPDDPDRGAALYNLGFVLRRRHEHSCVPSDLTEATECFHVAAELGTATPAVRIQAARAASRIEAPSNPAVAAALLRHAVGLLPTLTPRHFQRTDQQRALADCARLARDAAALTLDDPSIPSEQRPAIALKLLEAGRAIIYSQLSQIRSEVTELAREHPELARHFTDLRDRLNHSSAITTADDIIATSVTIDHPTPDRRALAREFDAVLTTIQSTAGFESFARPPSLDQLRAHAAKGAIVVFNLSNYRCDALLLTEHSISVLALSDLELLDVAKEANAFHRALLIANHGATGTERRAAQSRVRQTLAWLWDKVVGPILDALGHRTCPGHDATWPQVWWCARGPLGLLPLHAAGHYPSTSDTALDRVISSYTPTVGALSYSRQRQTTKRPLGASRALIVSMPNTPDIPGRLSYVGAETAMLARLLPGSVVLTTTADTDGGAAEPTHPDRDVHHATEHLPIRANVLKLLPDFPIAHFACHGMNDRADPSGSRLLLLDHATSPLTVATLATVHLEGAALAYLSACETALATNVPLLDEELNLAASFQLAGFPHVIGTLWTINDDVAVEIATQFYTAAVTSGDNPRFDADMAATALHRTVRHIRDQLPGTPSLWAAYIHSGV